jgi:hypothetical protein
MGKSVTLFGAGFSNGELVTCLLSDLGELASGGRGLPGRISPVGICQTL